MPFYTFRNKETEEEWTDMMSNSSREQYLAENPNIEQVFTSGLPQLDPMRVGVRKPDDQFKKRLDAIQRGHPHGKW